MKKNEKKNLFCPGEGNLPSLYRDMIFAEYVRPILFSCVDDVGGLYICTCFRADGKAVEWLAARTTEEDVIDLLNNRVTIRGVFPRDDGEVFRLTLSQGEKYPSVKETSAAQLPPELFPTEGYYMDASDGEFEEECRILRERIDRRESSRETITQFGNNYYIFTKTVFSEFEANTLMMAALPSDRQSTVSNRFSDSYIHFSTSFASKWEGLPLEPFFRPAPKDEPGELVFFREASLYADMKLPLRQV